ncbi:MAG: hypothetical protein RL150_303 [Candidatus Parcubacteria bacterium]
MTTSTVSAVELRVEDDIRRRKVQLPHECRRFGGTELTIHPTVFPLDRQRPFVADVVQRTDDALKVDPAAPNGLEVPEALAVVEVDVTTEHSGISRHIGPPDVLHVDVVDAVGEAVDEFDVVDTLVGEMARIIVEPERRMVVNRSKRALGRGDVEGDFGRMDLQGEFHTVLLEDVHDRTETASKILEAYIDLPRKHRRKRVDEVPDRGSSETVHHADAEFLGGHGSALKLLSGALAHTFGIAVAPDVVRENLLVAIIDVVADGLSDEVRGDGVAFHTTLIEIGTFCGTILRIGLGFGDIEVITPAAELDTLIAHRFCRGHDGFKREIGPLAGEKSDRAPRGRGGGIVHRVGDMD